MELSFNYFVIRTQMSVVVYNKTYGIKEDSYTKMCLFGKEP